MATVVSALRDRVSSVMSFSVDSTVISLIVRISVVFPAENGPVTTILTAVPPCLRRLRAGVLIYNPLTPAMRRSSRLLFTLGSRSMYGEATGAVSAAGCMAVAPWTAPTEAVTGRWAADPWVAAARAYAGAAGSAWSGWRGGVNGSGRSGMTGVRVAGAYAGARRAGGADGGAAGAGMPSSALSSSWRRPTSSDD